MSNMAPQSNLHMSNTIGIAQSPGELPGLENLSPPLSTAPKYGTLVPNRIFVGGISCNTTEVELAQLFSAYGHVKATKIIADRAGVSKGYGFVTFETEEEAQRIHQDTETIYLRDRKLNIAPAIKKQPFCRSIDGAAAAGVSSATAYLYGPAAPQGFPYQNMGYFPSTIPATVSEQPTVYQAPVSAPGLYPAMPNGYPPYLYQCCTAQPMYIQQQYQPYGQIGSSNGYVSGEHIPPYQVTQPVYVLLDSIQY